MKVQKFITEANKQQVCRLLGWSFQQYAEYQEAKGIEYLREVVCGDDWSVSNVAKCQDFWNWWKNHWNLRDAEFIAAAASIPLSWRQMRYNDLNDVDGIEFWPHKVIMENSYSFMIGEVIDHVTA